MNGMKLSVLRKQLEQYDDQCALRLLREAVEKKILLAQHTECSQIQRDLDGFLVVIDNLQLSESERNAAVTKSGFWNNVERQHTVLQSLFDCDRELNTAMTVVKKITGVSKNVTD